MKRPAGITIVNSNLTEVNSKMIRVNSKINLMNNNRLDIIISCSANISYFTAGFDYFCRS
jgi:hypothetical protein